MENVLVVPSALLRPYLSEKGLIFEHTEAVLEIIRQNFWFIRRDLAENDRQNKQIIPYATICRGDEVFVTRRTNKGFDARLRGMLSLGVGGHISDTDLEKETDVFMCGLLREIDEEVSIERQIGLKTIGVINDDTTDVGSVHLGLFCVLDVLGGVSVRETEKLEGFWAKRSKLDELSGPMESWSEIIIPALAGGLAK